MTSSRAKELSFDQLPDNGRGCLADLWGPPGSAARYLGTLNLIDSTAVLNGRNAIEHGISIGLNLPLDQISPPAVGRAEMQHQRKGLPGFSAMDDIYTLNPQQTSQWDAFQHWCHTSREKTFDGLSQSEVLDHDTSQPPILQTWAQRGIVARGVLLDFAAYASRHKIADFHPVETFAITMEHIQAMLSEQKVEIRPGDILVIHQGFTNHHRFVYTDSERQRFAEKIASPDLPAAGLEQSQELARFLWNSRISAIASDSLSVERFPPVNKDWILHDLLLSSWGMPMGELFDLHELAATCQKLQKFDFMLASAPFNYANGLSSLANAVAIL
ncbi:hypothetical protein BCV70DRAFT_198063 [Testicularia cyperi]|uniref:Cyclase n=1 Tax=Testicularia cyperi TaxID=1882483 RepID=A0A317Y008_9BASI|nr:hypothetical protein BCV70DRAFT_198063 [Testicularia cyperi]